MLCYAIIMYRTQRRLTLYIRVRVDKAVCVFWYKDAGLDEAQQGVELLQVVLNGSPCQQDSESHEKLQEKNTNKLI